MAKKPSAPPAAATREPAQAMTLHGRSLELFESVQCKYELDDVARGILRSAAEALQRSDEAAAIVTRDGMIITDRFGIPSKHPASILERDFRTQAITALQKLGLNLEG